jgi:hypothetical protein
LVVAIATIGVEGGHMTSSTASALIGAAVLTMLLFPILSVNLLDSSSSGKGKSSKGGRGRPRRPAVKPRKASA